jgi:hypothetical protein
MMSDDPLGDRLMRQVRQLLVSVWEGRIDLKDVEAWLDQFDDAADSSQSERLQALFLLSQFMYFGAFEVRALLRALYRDQFQYPLIARTRRSNGDTTDRQAIDAALASELARTRFVGLGNPSESSTHLLYYFRQENRLARDLFIGPDQIFQIARIEENFVQVIRNEKIRNYVLIDDLCGSGRQVEDYSASIAVPLRALAERRNIAVEISYIALFGTSDGIGHVRELDTFDRVEAVVELDRSFQCFSSTSRYYANEGPPIDRALAERVCRRLGATLYPKHPLGFDDGQLLLGFHHNTPDNTLPIFSFDEPDAAWTPLFKRYAKVG